MNTTAPAVPARRPAADLDGYVQGLPADRLTVTELFRERTRTTRLRAALPLGDVRNAVVRRQQDVHRELLRRLATLGG